MYKDLKYKEKVIVAIENLKNKRIEKNINGKIFIQNIYLIPIIIILKNFYLRQDLVPDEKTLIIKYSRSDVNLSWPFSLKEIYDYFLQK